LNFILKLEFGLGIFILAVAFIDLTTISYIHDLNNDMFRVFVEYNDLVAIAFVLPWLPSYERFAREWEEVCIDRSLYA
jgi:hypothetical protein